MIVVAHNTQLLIPVLFITRNQFFSLNSIKLCKNFCVKLVIKFDIPNHQILINQKSQADICLTFDIEYAKYYCSASLKLTGRLK